MLDVEKEQKEKPIKPRGYWGKRRCDGEKLFCFKGRQNGRKVYYELTLKEIEEFLKQL